MLKVNPASPTVDFYKKVTLPGREYLKKHPDARGHVSAAIWQTCRHAVYTKYHGICAYLAVRLVDASGYEVDHFHPKASFPKLAFEWNNLRLSCPHMNRMKGARTVADAFTLPTHALRINFLTGRISIAQDIRISRDMYKLLCDTIDILDLNACEVRETRTVPYTKYKMHRLRVDDLTCDYPFVAFEMLRQDRLDSSDRVPCATLLEQLGYPIG